MRSVSLFLIQIRTSRHIQLIFCESWTILTLIPHSHSTGWSQIFEVGGIPFPCCYYWLVYLECLLYSHLAWHCRKKLRTDRRHKRNKMAIIQPPLLLLQFLLRQVGKVLLIQTHLWMFGRAHLCMASNGGLYSQTSLTRTAARSTLGKIRFGRLSTCTIGRLMI